MITPVSNSDAEAPAGVRVVEITREPVELYKILKFEGMASSGGEAKAMVAAGQVLVNGKVEIQKRKKIVSGDTVEFNNDKISIKLSSTVVARVVAPKKKAATAPKRKARATPKTKATAAPKKKVAEGKSGKLVIKGTPKK